MIGVLIGRTINGVIRNTGTTRKQKEFDEILKSIDEV